MPLPVSPIPPRRRLRPRLAGAAALAALLLAGCQISPVVSTPEGSTGRYADCDRAARDYCEKVVDAPPSERDRCVAERRYACVAGDAGAP